MTQLLTIIRGLPGSGKSVLAETIARANPNTVVVEADTYFLSPNGEYIFNSSKVVATHACCFNATSDYLTVGISVIVSNTFSCMWEMQPYIDLAKKLDIPLRVIELYAVAGWENIHKVPEEVIDRMKYRWEHYHE